MFFPDKLLNSLDPQANLLIFWAQFLQNRREVWASPFSPVLTPLLFVRYETGLGSLFQGFALTLMESKAKKGCMSVDLSYSL